MKKRDKLSFALLALLFATAMVACGMPPNTPVQLDETFKPLGTTGAQGGQLCSESALCLTFPANAVTKDTTIEARRVKDTEAPQGAIGPVYELKAAQEKFDKKIELTLPVPAANQKDDLVVAFRQGDTWVPVETKTAEDGAKRIGMTDHLSVWGLVSRSSIPKTCQNDSDCDSTGQECRDGTCQDFLMDGNVGQDGGPTDAGSPDNNATNDHHNDAGPSDATPTDAGPQDTSPVDAGPPTDVKPGDAGPGDTEPSDRPDPKDAPPTDGGPADIPPTPCQADSDCRMGEACISGTCRNHTPDGEPVQDSPPSDGEFMDDVPPQDGGVKDGGSADGGSADVPPNRTCQADSDCRMGEACISGTCQSNLPD